MMLRHHHGDWITGDLQEFRDGDERAAPSASTAFTEAGADGCKVGIETLLHVPLTSTRSRVALRARHVTIFIAWLRHYHKTG